VMRACMDATPDVRRRNVRGVRLTALVDETHAQEDPMATVIGRSADELRAERQALIRRAGIDEAELRNRASSYQLTSEQMDILDAINGIDYLLED
jgi:hypothetical protein